MLLSIVLFNNKKKQRMVLFLLAYIVIYVFFVFVSRDNEPVSYLLSDVMTLIGEGAACLILFRAILHNQDFRRAEWKFFAFSMVMLFCGDLVWSYNEVILGRDMPLVSFCDVFYVSELAFCLLGFVFYIKKESLYDMIRISFDMVITMTICTTFVLKYIMMPIWQDHYLSLIQRTVSMLYPIFDIGLLGGVFSLALFARRRKTKDWRSICISVAFVIWLTSDMSYSVLSQSMYVSGGWVDILWPVGALVLSCAVLIKEPEKNVQMSELKKRTLGEEVFGKFCFVLPYAVVIFCVMQVDLLYKLVDPMVVGISVTVILIAIRQVFSSLENQRLFRIIEKTNHELELKKQELESKNEELRILTKLKEEEANTDFLTQLFNRRYIDEKLENWRMHGREERNLNVSILMIDIDHYKQINDTWGHKTGDVVLQKVSELIRASIEPKDILGRFGGDEFILIMPDTDFQHTKMLASQLVKKIEETVFEEGAGKLFITLSIGGAFWAGLEMDFIGRSLLKYADEALYRAKGNGRNQSCIVQMGS